MDFLVHFFCCRGRKVTCGFLLQRKCHAIVFAVHMYPVVTPTGNASRAIGQRDEFFPVEGHHLYQFSFLLAHQF